MVQFSSEPAPHTRQAKLIILDRDGVINYDSDQYIRSPEEWRPIPGSLEAVARLNHAGFRVVVATNQSGVGRGLLDIATPALRRDLDRVHWLVPGDRVAQALRERGVSGPILRASTAEDQDLVAAVVRWRSSVSGAQAPV